MTTDEIRDEVLEYFRDNCTPSTRQIEEDLRRAGGFSFFYDGHGPAKPEMLPPEERGLMLMWLGGMSYRAIGVVMRIHHTSASARVRAICERYGLSEDREGAMEATVKCRVCNWEGTVDELDWQEAGEPRCPDCLSDELKYGWEGADDDE